MDPPTVLATSFDHVVDRRTESPRLLEPKPELDALHDVDAHDRGRQRGIEPAIPVHIRAEPDRQPVDHDLEDTPDRIAG